MTDDVPSKWDGTLHVPPKPVDWRAIVEEWIAEGYYRRDEDGAIWRKAQRVPYEDEWDGTWVRVWFQSEPPESDLCRKCYAWQPYPSPQEQFGWGWWRTCWSSCGCEHHKTEVWIA